MKTDILVIGGGLSGLAAADMLHQRGVDYQLVEARDRFGGRVLTDRSNGAYYDLGPAWFWPGQPRMAALVERFGLERFDQHYRGILTFEDETGAVQRGRGYASMQGSWRLVGGLQSMTDALVADLPENRRHLGKPLASVTLEADAILARFADGAEISAQQVILALPPRVAAETISFSPPLPATATAAMSNIATWMAGQAKAVALYDAPFWRKEGLSGDAMSRVGPMVEIHDASPASGETGALFGFIGTPPSARQDEAELRAQILGQLGRLFGPRAAMPVELVIKDWAHDLMIATEADTKPLFAHPQYGLPTAMTNLMEGRLIFAGTEVAPEFGGFLEGALEAAERAVAQITEYHRNKPAA